MSAKPEGMPVGDRASYHNERFPFSLFNEVWAQRNHYQSLARLAERGGLSWGEAAANIERRRWLMMDKADAEAIVRNALRDSDRDREADETRSGSVSEGDRARAEGIAHPSSEHPNAI